MKSAKGLNLSVLEKSPTHKRILSGKFKIKRDSDLLNNEKSIISNKDSILEENTKLKISNNKLKNELALNRGELIKMESELKQKEKLIENLLLIEEGANSNNSNILAGNKGKEYNLIVSLKRNIKECQHSLKIKEDEVSELKKSSKFTKSNELTLENKTVYDEYKKIKDLYEKLQEETNKKNEKFMKDINFLQNTLNRQQNLVTSLQDHNNKLSEESDKKSLKINEQKEKLNKLKEELKEITSHNQKLKIISNDNENHVQKISELTVKLEEKENNLKNKKDKLQTLKKDLQQRHASIDELKVKVDAQNHNLFLFKEKEIIHQGIVTEKAQLQEKVANLQKEIDFINLKVLEEKNENLKLKENYEEEILKLKENYEEALRNSKVNEVKCASTSSLTEEEFENISYFLIKSLEAHKIDIHKLHEAIFSEDIKLTSKDVVERLSDKFMEILKNYNSKNKLILNKYLSYFMANYGEDELTLKNQFLILFERIDIYTIKQTEENDASLKEIFDCYKDQLKVIIDTFGNSLMPYGRFMNTLTNLKIDLEDDLFEYLIYRLKSFESSAYEFHMLNLEYISHLLNSNIPQEDNQFQVHSNIIIRENLLADENIKFNQREIIEIGGARIHQEIIHQDETKNLIEEEPEQFEELVDAGSQSDVVNIVRNYLELNNKKFDDVFNQKNFRVILKVNGNLAVDYVIFINYLIQIRIIESSQVEELIVSRVMDDEGDVSLTKLREEVGEELNTEIYDGISSKNSKDLIDNIFSQVLGCKK